MAVAIGSTKGACAIRYKRLKDKIEKDTGVAAGNTTKATPAAQQSNIAKDKKKNATPRKRKATDFKDEDDDDDNGPLPSQVDGPADLPPRQSRGKKVNYDVLAGTLYSSDDEFSLSSFENGDGDFVFKTVKSEDEDDSICGGGSDDEPVVKRFKKSQSAVTPPPTVRKFGNVKAQKTAQSNDAKVLPRIPIPPKASYKSTMHPSQQPLPSIEFSPPSTPTPVKKKQSITSTDSDIDVKSLRPGTILKFPAKSRTPVSSVPPTPAERFWTPITIGSSVSSAHESAGRMLKQNLIEHAEQIELCPEDSISNIGAHAAKEDSVAVPSTPTGKHLKPTVC